MGKNTQAYDILVGKPEGEQQLGRLEDFKVNLKPYDGSTWIGFDWLRMGTSSRLLLMW